MAPSLNINYIWLRICHVYMQRITNDACMLYHCKVSSFLPYCAPSLHRFTDSYSCMLWAHRRRICNDAAEPLVDGRTIVDSRGTFGSYPARFAPMQHCSLLQLLIMQAIGPLVIGHRSVNRTCWHRSWDNKCPCLSWCSC